MSASEYRPYDRLAIGVLAMRASRVVYVNDAAAALLGGPAAQLIGLSSRELAMHAVAPSDRALVFSLSDAFARGEATPSEIWISLANADRTDRSVRFVQSAAPVEGDLFLVLVPSEAESATRRLAEAMVVAAAEFVRCREEQEVLDAAVNAIHEKGYLITIMQWTEDGLVVRAMRQDDAMLQRGGELYGIPAHEVRFDPKKVPHFQRMFDTRRAVYVADAFTVFDSVHIPEVARMLRETLPRLSEIDTPLFVEGQPFGILHLTGENLTPSCVATVELFGQLVGSGLENVRHHRRSRERLTELTHLQQELVSRERLAAIGEAAGVLSHEARNPLGAILNALAVLRRSSGLSADSQLVLDIAEEESLRLDALVRDLLELARPLEARCRPVRVDGVVDAAINDFTRKRGRGAVRIAAHIAPALPEAMADATLLRLALENLLRNAVQAGGGAPVEVSVLQETESVIVAVTHVCSPRPHAEGNASFDPFSVAQAGGTGLGLAVVKRVIEAQGGWVRARDGGSRLELLLPIAADGDRQG